jgi:hypothetical protein
MSCSELVHNFTMKTIMLICNSSNGVQCCKHGIGGCNVHKALPLEWLGLQYVCDRKATSMEYIPTNIDPIIWNMLGQSQTGAIHLDHN